jgi:hypothetical protein
MGKLYAAATFLAFCCVSVSHADAPTTPGSSKACDRQMVMQIDSAKITSGPDGFMIDAFGTSESAGWKNATVIFAGRTGETAAVDFVACRPEVSAQVLTPIQARATLDLGASVKQIIIRAKTNTMTIDITRQ